METYKTMSTAMGLNSPNINKLLNNNSWVISHNKILQILCEKYNHYNKLKTQQVDRDHAW